MQRWVGTTHLLWKKKKRKGKTGVGGKIKCIWITYRLTSQRQEIQGKDTPGNDRKKPTAVSSDD